MSTILLFHINAEKCVSFQTTSEYLYFSLDLFSSLDHMERKKIRGGVRNLYRSGRKAMCCYDRNGGYWFLNSINKDRFTLEYKRGDMICDTTMEYSWSLPHNSLTTPVYSLYTLRLIVYIIFPSNIVVQENVKQHGILSLDYIMYSTSRVRFLSLRVSRCDGCLETAWETDYYTVTGEGNYRENGVRTDKERIAKLTNTRVKRANLFGIE